MIRDTSWMEDDVSEPAPPDARLDTERGVQRLPEGIVTDTRALAAYVVLRSVDDYEDGHCAAWMDSATAQREASA